MVYHKLLPLILSILLPFFTIVIYSVVNEVLLFSVGPEMYFVQIIVNLIVLNQALLLFLPQFFLP